jgi:hypothetical protein
MDRITSSLLGEFSRDHSIEALPEDQRFERFAAYLSILPHLPETFDTADVATGSGGDTGIDAIAIVVNGTLVTDAELVSELAETNGYLDVTFIFVQAERSASFEAAKIGTFGFGVADFFREAPTLPRNEAVSEAAAIASAIFDCSSKFTRGNPSCRLYYVTTGRWTDDANLVARKRTVEEDLAATRLFGEASLTPIDADAVQRLYNQSKNAIARDFTFANRTLIPDIPGVSEAYLGYLPASEFLSLLRDDAGNLVKSIFYDNVRDWQDYNTVNSEIKATLSDPAQRRRFSLMNNGVTVIAKTLRATGNRFHIEDYQIVNGCQTSHVIFDNRALLDDSALIPVRLIATQDEEVIAAVVKATNRQTQVKEEQLLALNDFQKKLESYFATFPDPRRLYYERRSRQYNTAAGVEKTRIVTLPNLIRAYAAVVLEEPHRTTRNFRALLERVGKTIFGAEHRLEPYYMSAAALYRIDYLFRTGAIPAQYKPARHHIMLAARLLQSPDRWPLPNSRDAARRADEYAAVLWDPAQADALMARGVQKVDEIAQGNLHRDNIRTQPFTEGLIRVCRG